MALVAVRGPSPPSRGEGKETQVAGAAGARIDQDLVEGGEVARAEREERRLSGLFGARRLDG